MRNNTTISDEEINTRKRLRPLFTFLHTQALDHGIHLKQKKDDADPVEEGACAAELGHYMRDHGMEYADLMALRERPYHWDHFHAQQWEWFLRRLMNGHSEAIRSAMLA